jgi:hypothetical protein
VTVIVLIVARLLVIIGILTVIGILIVIRMLVFFWPVSFGLVTVKGTWVCNKTFGPVELPGCKYLVMIGATTYS